MRTSFTTVVCLSLLLMAGAATSPGEAANQVPELVNIELSNFAFSPENLHLHAGRAYQLRFTNLGSGGHNYSAPAFFAAATIDPEDRRYVKKGKVELAKGQALSIRLVPAAGSYQVKCTHLLHASFGMKGSIVAD